MLHVVNGQIMSRVSNIHALKHLRKNGKLFMAYEGMALVKLRMLVPSKEKENYQNKSKERLS